MAIGDALALDLPWILTVLLLSVRLTAMLLMTPILAAAAVPVTIRVLLIFSMAVVLTIGFPQWRVPASMDVGALLSAALIELALGATMGLGILVAFGAFSVGGRLLDVQVGYGIGQVFDPVTRSQLPILTTIFNQLGIVVFFLSNGHHALLRGLAYSIERFPPGQMPSMTLAAGAVFKHVSGLFTLGFVLVAPVVLCILFVEFALSVLTRNLPQMQIFALAFSLKILVGLAALALWFVGVQSVIARIYASIFQTWQAAFQ